MARTYNVFKLEIRMNNAAFHDDDEKFDDVTAATELSRILHNLAYRVEQTCDFDHKMSDINGSTVGHSTVIKRK
jgi:hypothetical protein